jgi:hypothetical protein
MQVHSTAYKQMKNKKKRKKGEKERNISILSNQIKHYGCNSGRGGLQKFIENHKKTGAQKPLIKRWHYGKCNKLASNESQCLVTNDQNHVTIGASYKYKVGIACESKILVLHPFFSLFLVHFLLAIHGKRDY